MFDLDSNSGDPHIPAIQGYGSHIHRSLQVTFNKIAGHYAGYASSVFRWDVIQGVYPDHGVG